MKQAYLASSENESKYLALRKLTTVVFLTSSIGSGSGTHVAAVHRSLSIRAKNFSVLHSTGKESYVSMVRSSSQRIIWRSHSYRARLFPCRGCGRKGSMTREIIPSFVKHLDKYVRNFLPSSTSYLLTLDGHKSRIGFECLELCQENNCEVVQAPANTSHFL